MFLILTNPRRHPCRSLKVITQWDGTLRTLGLDRTLLPYRDDGNYKKIIWYLYSCHVFPSGKSHRSSEVTRLRRLLSQSEQLATNLQLWQALRSKERLLIASDGGLSWIKGTFCQIL